MFIINLQYIVPLKQLDAQMSAHVKFLQTHYKKGIFHASGRKVPRTGGIILAVGKSKEEIEILMSEDPFVKSKLASVEVIEFLTSQTHPAFKKMMQQLTN